MAITREQGVDAGRTYTEYYDDSRELIQRWYGPHADAPREPDPKEWVPMVSDDSPDRTDPGYWLDNF